MQKDNIISKILGTTNLGMIIVGIALVVAIVAFMTPIFRGGRTALHIDGEKKRLSLATSSYREPTTPKGIVAPTAAAKKQGRGSHTVKVLPDGTVTVTVNK